MKKDWDRTISINLKGQSLCGQAAPRKTAKNKRGRVMNIVSVSQEACGGVFPEMARFMASKGGVATSAEAAPLPLADMGVDCNANHP
jgi:NAD(P)-dependent dehydrogenase (short-subunit alcohol dehydrogenase family)